MIYLDTHVVVRLCAENRIKFSNSVENLIEKYEVSISAIVCLELQYLLEIKRIAAKPEKIISNLASSIGLKICDKNFNTIISKAMSLSWTRDPFDRIIVANAAINNSVLITKDQHILEHYENAKW
ncbi:MAG: PIN domain-containing protein [SAR324 cluster bacterium]|nr:PIN domain-containing protein [SAR324 cluster bacterium]MCH2266057.1 PIN domain-containing protein [SAR324 cluster bacterium]MCH2270899.1 PIN domain-containing protein [SAR324 cluster bacterium]